MNKFLQFFRNISRNISQQRLTDEKRQLIWLLVLVATFLAVIFSSSIIASERCAKTETQTIEPVMESESTPKKKLSAEQHHVTREKGTEAPFSGKYWDHHEKGVYRCVSCGTELFESTKKFDSGSGWPSFRAPVDEKNIAEHKDSSHGMTRTEVVCKKCEAHLGHVFDDGPAPEGRRYCINSASLDFESKDK